MRLDLRLLWVLACFFGSGLAALLYQTAWTREFAFVFGTSELAVVSVLAAYMAGLAVGSAVAARLAPRVTRPVLVYGLLELGIGAAALAVPFAIAATTRLFVLGFGERPTPPDELGLIGALFHVGCSFLILVVPTALMGATLPLLARHAVHEDRELGPRVAILYGVNTAGAVVGAVAAGFWLLPCIGLRNTVYTGVAVNLGVAAVAMALGRTPVAPPEAGSATARTGPAHLILPAIALSGAASFVYEVLWTRLLGYLLGTSVEAFATMLATFLAGIALGSAAAFRLSRTRELAWPSFAGAQLGIASLSLAAFVALDRLPGLADALGAGFQGSRWVNALLAGSVLLPSALCIGATFPFAVRALASGAPDAAAASARVYAWNTFGAIVGALLCGFVLIPRLGIVSTVTIAAATNLVLAALFGLTRPGLAGRTVGGLALALAVLVAFSPPPRPWQLLRSSPIGASPSGRVTFAADGRSASVLVLARGGEWQLRTNGLPESEIQGPGGREAKYPEIGWMAALPTLLYPDARSMLVIGFGGGQVVEAVPPNIATIDVIELEPEVVNAARALGPLRRRDPLADPRLRIHLNDARGALLLTRARYDAIVSQPSHPWTAGASHLYTREFFELVRERLTVEGVFVQWMHSRFVDPPLVRSLMATLTDVFPYVNVFHRGSALLFAASVRPLDPVASSTVALEHWPTHLAQLGLGVPEDLAARWLLDPDGARRFAAGAEPIRDDHNRLADRAGRVSGLGETGVDRLFAVATSPVAARPDLDLGYTVQVASDDGDRERAKALALRIPQEAERAAAAAHVMLAMGRREQGLELVRRVLEQDPTNRRARALLLRSGLADRLPGGPDATELLVTGGKDPAQLEALEPKLAEIGPRHPLYNAATRERVRWRIASGDLQLGHEALHIVDTILARRRSPRDYVLRIRAARAARLPEAALATVQELIYLNRHQGIPPPFARELLELLKDVPDSGLHPAWRRAIVRWLGLQIGP